MRATGSQLCFVNDDWLSFLIRSRMQRRLRLKEGGEGRKDMIRKINIRISPDKLMVLHHELKQALSYMESIK